jgi:hypothetical protein
MASTYSTNLKIELIGTGDQSGTWGNTTNTNLGSLIEEAIAGYVTQAVTDGAATVLTIPNGSSSNGRNYVIELTGSLTAARTVEVPAVDKPYIFFNNTTGGYAVTVKVSGQTGVTIANGKKAIVYTNSTDVIEVANAPVTEAGTQTLTNKTMTSPTLNTPTISSPTITGALVVPTSTTPAQTTDGSVVWDSDDNLLTVGDGVSRKTMADTTTSQTLTNKTLTSPTINTPTITGSGGTLTLPAGPDTLVALATSGTLTNKTINGSNNTITNVSLSTGVTGTLPVANGGSGQTSYTDGQLLIGNTTGNTLTKSTLTAGTGISVTNGSGSITISSTASSSGIDVQSFTGSGTWTKPAYSASSRVLIQAWGGGGSGAKNNGSGGGGGAYNERWLTLSQLGATETVTVGAGGTAVTTNINGNNGGTTTVGSLISSYGGGAGGTGQKAGGGGGGQFGAGTGGGTGTATAGYAGAPVVILGDQSTATYSGWGFGGGATNSAVTGSDGMGNLWGGGGGGSSISVGNGGSSVYGGGGGGGATASSSTGGSSVNGGAGGAGGGGSTSGTAGTQPAGGGGGTNTGATSGAGGAGQVIITVFPA